MKSLKLFENFNPDYLWPDAIFWINKLEPEELCFLGVYSYMLEKEKKQSLFEVVYQGTDLANATFSGTCLSFNNDTNVLRLINTSGTASNGFTLIGETTGTTRTVLNVSLPDYIPYSGYITYIENRAGTQRSSDGSEQVRLVVGFN